MLVLIAVLGLIGGFSHDARTDAGSIYAHYYIRADAMHEEVKFKCRAFGFGYLVSNGSGYVAQFR